MYKNRHYVGEKSVKKCGDCWSPITFAKNQSGKWLAVDASRDARGEWFWQRRGNNNNFIVTHQCTFAKRRILLEQAWQQLCCLQKKAPAIFAALLRQSKESGIELTEDTVTNSEYGRLAKIISRANERIQRRVSKSGIPENALISASWRKVEVDGVACWTK